MAKKKGNGKWQAKWKDHGGMTCTSTHHGASHSKWKKKIAQSEEVRDEAGYLSQEELQEIFDAELAAEQAAAMAEDGYSPFINESPSVKMSRDLRGYLDQLDDGIAEMDRERQKIQKALTALA